jgi:hypothetical protein
LAREIELHFMKTEAGNAGKTDRSVGNIEGLKGGALP